MLKSLPKEEFAAVKSGLEPVSFKLGDVLYESGAKMNYVYFPTTAVVSILYLTENGATAEIGIVGSDGVVGSALFMGGENESEGCQRGICRTVI